MRRKPTALRQMSWAHHRVHGNQSHCANLHWACLQRSATQRCEGVQLGAPSLLHLPWGATRSSRCRSCLIRLAASPPPPDGTCKTRMARQITSATTPCAPTHPQATLYAPQAPSCHRAFNATHPALCPHKLSKPADGHRRTCYRAAASWPAAPSDAPLPDARRPPRPPATPPPLPPPTLCPAFGRHPAARPPHPARVRQETSQERRLRFMARKAHGVPCRDGAVTERRAFDRDSLPPAMTCSSGPVAQFPVLASPRREPTRRSAAQHRRRSHAQLMNGQWMRFDARHLHVSSVEVAQHVSQEVAPGPRRAQRGEQVQPSLVLLSVRRRDSACRARSKIQPRSPAAAAVSSRSIVLRISAGSDQTIIATGLEQPIHMLDSLRPTLLCSST